MSRGDAIPNKRIITPLVEEQRQQKPRPRAAPQASSLRSAGGGGEAEVDATGLSTRVATADDLPWLQTWAAQLGLPAPRSRRVRSFILLKDGQRVGYMAAREDMAEDGGGGREPVMWIVSAFLIPSLRGQGMILKYGEMLSRQYYQKGKVGCRVAADNAPMMRLMSRGGWRKAHSTRRFTDFVLELDAPFRATRKG
jgi:hypothetical protein